MSALLPPAARTGRPRRAGPFVLALLLALSLVGPSSAAEAPRDELEDVESRIASTLSQLDDVAGRAAESADALADAQAAVAQLEAELNEVLAAVTAQEERVSLAREEADAAVAERERVEGLATQRALRAFMGGVPSDLVLFGDVGGQDLEGALDRIAMLDVLAARDVAAIESLDVVRVQADAAAERLVVALDDLEAARATQERALDAAEVVFEARADALAEVEGEEERLLARQELLEDEQDDLQALIRRQEEEARRAAAAAAEAAASSDDTSSSGSSGGSGGSSAPAAAPAPPPSSGGCYAWPAAGGVTSEFGPRWGRLHAGLDIDGNTGDAIYAAQSGTVVFVGFQGGYGRLTLISHGDGVTSAYAHQSSASVSSGQTVARGQYIGAIGTTGAVTGSHLHFETRTSSGARNPRNYLC